MNACRKNSLYLLVFLLLPSAVFAAEQESSKETEKIFEEKTTRASDSTRVVYAPTAVGREKGEVGLTVYDLALYDIEYGLFKHLEVGLYVAAPITFVAFAPHAKLWSRLSPSATLALNASGDFIFPYLENDRGQQWWILSAGPLLTLGSSKTYFNLGVNMSGTNSPIHRGLIEGFVSPSSKQSSQDYDKPWWFISPSIGAVLRVSAKVSLMFQAEMFIAQSAGLIKFSPVSYGLRFHGKHVVLDAAFVLPVYKDMWEIVKYCPIGFPLITISKTWP